jgi:hypothetical protein
VKKVPIFNVVVKVGEKVPIFNVVVKVSEKSANF